MIEITKKKFEGSAAPRVLFFIFFFTWDALKGTQIQVAWWKLTCFLVTIPKQTFILWLGMKDALTIGDKLLRCRYKREVYCVFYRHGTCSFNVVIAREIGNKL